MAIRAMSNLGDSPSEDSDVDSSATRPTPIPAAAAAVASGTSHIKMDPNNHLGAHLDPIAEYAEQHSTKEHPYLAKVMSTPTRDARWFFLFRV